MTNKRQIIFLYIGIICGTALFNFGVGIPDGPYNFNAGINEYLRLLMIRSVEMLFLLLLANRFVQYWDIIVGLLSGIITGYILSLHSVNTNILNQLIYSVIVLIIVILYSMIFSFQSLPGGMISLKKDTKLHNPVLSDMMVIAILLINSFLELKIVKFF